MQPHEIPNGGLSITLDAEHQLINARKMLDAVDAMDLESVMDLELLSGYFAVLAGIRACLVAHGLSEILNATELASVEQTHRILTKLKAHMEGESDGGPDAGTDSGS